MPNIPLPNPDYFHLTERDYLYVADKINVPVDTIKAVVLQEAGGRSGFDKKFRQVILFEPHLFHDETHGKYTKDHPNISSAHWNKDLYPHTIDGIWDQLSQAFALDPLAAVRSTSWGITQILGMEYDEAGYISEWDMINAFNKGEPAQLLGFAQLIKHRNLDVALRNLDWCTFARRYNGAGYAANEYDVGLARNYSKAIQDTVLRAQKALCVRGYKLTCDGRFGPITGAAVEAFQNKNKLPITGRLDNATLSAIYNA